MTRSLDHETDDLIMIQYTYWLHVRNVLVSAKAYAFVNITLHGMYMMVIHTMHHLNHRASDHVIL